MNLIIYIVFCSVKVMWERVKVSVGHPDYSEKLKSFIVAYNAKHL